MQIHEILKHYPEVSSVHPACLAVPEISDDDRKALNADIARDGLLHEIILTQDGQLIDGRNRLVACYLGSIEPRFKKTSRDPWDVAYSENIARRHLQVGQLAMFGAARKAWEAAEATKRFGGRHKTNGPVMFPELKETLATRPELRSVSAERA
jgi:hypothetical protein